MAGGCLIALLCVLLPSNSLAFAQQLNATEGRGKTVEGGPTRRQQILTG